MQQLPSWLRQTVRKNYYQKKIRSLLGDNSIQTVCESALCPNRGYCFKNKTVTFLLMGNICTRNCRFCGVSKGNPFPVQELEAQQIQAAIKKLSLTYVVLTSVTRDDLSDFGAAHFAQVIQYLRSNVPGLRIEILTPDFSGDLGLLKKVLKTGPEVFNHNLETVPALYSLIRPEADYYRSLSLLNYSRKNFPDIIIKSGLMLGLGETNEQINHTLKDLAQAGTDVVTIGQYLQPAKSCINVQEYITEQLFDEYRIAGEKYGLKVLSGPLVRSSYKAEELYKLLKGENSFVAC